MAADDQLDPTAGNALPIAPGPERGYSFDDFLNSPLAQGFRVKNLLGALSPISAVHPGTATQAPTLDWQVPPLAQELYRQVTNVGAGIRGRHPLDDQTSQDITSLMGGMASPSVAMEMDPETLAAFNAWHGSPHTFGKTELGHPEFLDEKMGTGEGAQVRGWGHYIAERPGTASSYQGSGDLRAGFGDHSPADLDKLFYEDADPSNYDPALSDPAAKIAFSSYLFPTNFSDTNAAQKNMVPNAIERIRRAVENSQTRGYGALQRELQTDLRDANQELAHWQNLTPNSNFTSDDISDAQLSNQKTINGIQERLKMTPEEWAAEQQPWWQSKLDVADWLEKNGHKVTVTDPTSLYRTAILPDEDQLLHLDLPLASQPEGVKEALRNMDPGVWEGLNKYAKWRFSALPFDNEKNWIYYNGDALVKALMQSPEAQGAMPDVMANGHETTAFSQYGDRNNNSNAKNASKYLDSIGIPGSMFFDQKSRGEGQYLADKLVDIENIKAKPATYNAMSVLDIDRLNGLDNDGLDAERSQTLDKIYGPDSELTHNYIIFDPKNIMITHRNGAQLVPGEYADAAKAFDYQNQLHAQAGLAPPTRLFPVRGNPFNPLTGTQPNLLTGTGQ
jgi:hypothetical protein